MPPAVIPGGSERAMIKIYPYGEVPPEGILSRREELPDVSGPVAEIIAAVRREGDRALSRYALAFDGAAIGFYLYMITFNTKSDRWFVQLALPITALATILVEIFALLLRTFRVSFITTALYFFVEIALLCVGIELLIDRYREVPLHLMWSAIVLTICGVIAIALLTILSKRRLREAVQRRLHF